MDNIVDTCAQPDTKRLPLSETFCIDTINAGVHIVSAGIIGGYMGLIVNDLDDLDLLERKIDSSALRAIESLLTSRDRGVRLLERIKFERIGWHPLEDRRLNLIEQVNQTFTYLTSFRAVRILFEHFPDTSFRLHLGTEPGPDIESVDQGLLAAEVFAAVSITNNNKLHRDIARVLRYDVQHRYVFFSVPGFETGRQPQLETADGVQLWAMECHAVVSQQSRVRQQT